MDEGGCADAVQRMGGDDPDVTTGSMYMQTFPAGCTTDYSGRRDRRRKSDQTGSVAGSWRGGDQQGSKADDP